MWNYLTAPFLVALPDFETEEIDPWQENGETWRRLRVKFPDYIATHSAEETFYVNSQGLVVRMDYNAAAVVAALQRTICWITKALTAL